MEIHRPQSGIFQGGILLIKTDANGNKIWSKLHYNLNSFVDDPFIELTGFDIQELKDGFIILVADLYDHNTFGLCKLNFQGDTIWTKKFGFYVNP